MKFIDEAEISVHAGKGGAGSVHFRREKYVPFGGPDGGDGGNGGSIILVADENRHTLLDLKLQPRLVASNGQPGTKSLRSGSRGDDLVFLVPIGTQVFPADGERALLADLDSHESQFTLVRGGRGGKGNAFFKSATNQAPRHAQPGEVGESGEFLLSLKLLADVGLVGLPNAGKSTLISRISSARPKIADYPFTTLEPNRGVVNAGKFFKGTGTSSGENSFVVADIPGLIPGAHTGKGLGIRFLKHIERTRLLVHLVDVSLLGVDGFPEPVQAFEDIQAELAAFSPSLLEKAQIIALTKVDALTHPDLLCEIKQTFEGTGLAVHCVSSVTGEGLPLLMQRISQLLAGISKEEAGDVAGEDAPEPSFDKTG